MRVSADSADRQPVVIAARRTAIGRAGGVFKDVRAHELLAPVLHQVLADAGLTADQLSDVIMGNAVGGGGNVARLAALTAGLPVQLPGLTVDRQCGSGLEAIVLASRLVAAGAGDAYLAGGVESISTAPARAHRMPDGGLDFYERAQFAPGWLGDPDVGHRGGECRQPVRHQPGTAGRICPAQPPARPRSPDRRSLRRRAAGHRRPASAGRRPGATAADAGTAGPLPGSVRAERDGDRGKFLPLQRWGLRRRRDQPREGPGARRG